jgi:hypothetical protein
MGLFMDDHLGSGKDFDAVFNFLHEHYFPRVAFGPVCLNQDKLNLFCSELEAIGFSASDGQLCPSSKHWDKIKNWPIPTSRTDVDDFIYLTPFLRMFIPGRAEHFILLKESYQKQETVSLKSGEKSARKI